MEDDDDVARCVLIGDRCYILRNDGSLDILDDRSESEIRFTPEQTYDLMIFLHNPEVTAVNSQAARQRDPTFLPQPL